MDPKIKKSKAETVSSKEKGRKPNVRRSNAKNSEPTAKMTGPSSMHTSPQQAYPGYPPASSQQHAHPPTAYSRHLPPSYATTEEIRSEALAEAYPRAYPALQRPGGIYIPPLSAREMLTGSLQTASYPLVGMLPSLGQYPGMQPQMYQSYLQSPILQVPVYSIGHIYQPQYSSSFQSLYQPQPQTEQQLLQYTEFLDQVDSSCPGLLELPSKHNNEYEALFGSPPPSHGLSLAESSRKFDEILGKRADQRTDEEKKFREEHLAARQNVHIRDASDRKRRRQMDRKPSCPEG